MVVLSALLLLAFIAWAAPTEKNSGFQLKKDQELQQIKPKKPVKIKLKRTPKNEYSWELAGDDVDELIKTDRRLRKLLNVP